MRQREKGAPENAPVKLPTAKVYYNMVYQGQKHNPDADPAEPPALPSRVSWHHRAVAAAVLAWVAANLILSWIFGDDLKSYSVLARFWIGLIPIHVAAFGAVLMVLAGDDEQKGQRLRALDLAPLPRNFPRVAKVSALAALCFFPVTAALNLVAAWLIRQSGAEPQLPPIAEFLQGMDKFPMVVSMIIGAVLVAPIVEEILFRLVFYEAVRPVGAGAAAVLTATAFALLHGTVVQFAALFGLALLLQYMRHRYKTLWSPILLHMTFNAASLLLFLYLSKHASEAL